MGQTYDGDRTSRVLMILGSVGLVGIVLYYAFDAIDRVALADQHGTGIVVDKQHRTAGTSYSTQFVGNRTVVLPQATAEMYIVFINVDGVASAASVDKTLYDALGPRDRVGITDQRRRLTGGLQVTAVTR